VTVPPVFAAPPVELELELELELDELPQAPTATAATAASRTAKVERLCNKILLLLRGSLDEEPI
jgi:hypothetical protein